MSRVRAPSPPVVSAAFSGFIVGVLLTLALTGVFSGASKTSSAGVNTPVSTLPPATPVSDNLLDTKLRRIVVRQLGAFTAPSAADPNGKPRLEWLKPFPAGPFVPSPDTSQRMQRYRSVWIQFRLNNHPLGKSWRLKAAKADVFTVLKALYTSQLPIYDVWMVGKFPLGPKNTGAEGTALFVYIDHRTAERIPWKHWARGTDEGRLWASLTTAYVDPRFA